MNSLRLTRTARGNRKVGWRIRYFLNSDVPAASFKVMGNQLSFGFMLGFADRGDRDLHELHGQCGNRPHLLDIIELAHFRAEDMDDDIARVDQHPVAGFFPLDRKRHLAKFF